MQGILDFAVVGTQKGGTSSLHEYLADHPKLCMSRPKEIHFFDNEIMDWKNPDYRSLYNSFVHAKPSQLWAESTPIYLFWPNSIQRLVEHNPLIKIICLLRDPIQRAYSGWRMTRALGVEPLCFSDAIRVGRTRISSELNEAKRLFTYVERGFYADQITNCWKYVPSDRTLFLRSEDLLSSKAKTLDRICDFVGVGKYETMPEDLLIRPHNPPISAPISVEDREYLSELYYDDLQYLKTLIGLEW